MLISGIRLAMRIMDGVYGINGTSPHGETQG
jgi:hypothetical protein